MLKYLFRLHWLSPNLSLISISKSFNLSFTGSLFISGSRISFDDGKQNIAIGTNSIGVSGFTGNQNIAIGENAMLDANGSNTGYNIVIGYNAGKSFGANNVYSNILIGRQAGMNINNGMLLTQLR